MLGHFIGYLVVCIGLCGLVLFVFGDGGWMGGCLCAGGGWELKEIFLWIIEWMDSYPDGLEIINKYLIHKHPYKLSLTSLSRKIEFLIPKFPNNNKKYKSIIQNTQTHKQTYTIIPQISLQNKMKYIRIVMIFKNLKHKNNIDGI